MTGSSAAPPASIRTDRCGSSPTARRRSSGCGSALALDDDHSEFLRRFRHDPMLGSGDAPACRAAPDAPPDRGARPAPRAVRPADRVRRARAIERRIVRTAIAGATTASTRRRRPPALRRSRPPSCAASASTPAAARRSSASAASSTSTACASCPRRRRGRLGRERGLGPWSVGVVALEGLGRYDLGLVGDLGLIKLLSVMRGRRVEGWETAGAAGPVRRMGRPRGRLPAFRVGPGAAAGEPGRAQGSLDSAAVSGRVAILGCGKIGESLLAGLLSSGGDRPGRPPPAVPSAPPS